MLGDYWVPSREKLVTEAKANMITFALIKGYDVVVDNMNLNPKEDAWIRTLCENIEKDTGIHVNIEYKDFWTPVEECIRRDAARPNPIGEKVIKETWRRYRNFIINSDIKEMLKNKAEHVDARCFNIPKEEVTNCILWRQQDATRNSISSAGQAYFSHKQLEGLNSNQIQELLFQEKGINWNDYPTKFKRGSCCIKKYHQTMNQTLRSYWFIDNEIPIFKGEDREYIEKLIA